ncbi:MULTISPECIES: hypothetical protein [Alphaproteobacteria]|uniref:Uncharacterized protein n=2 Tax=Alphaproteobacteria TaxID=28211 RepID=A0A512HIX7_9HYPH|nr:MULTISPECIES: hypothetical protein [Alphaproteobacteria]GEO85403.1 hypothetical protein RNA01_23350 [Ciceribacter naphthalenivorans]GLR21042.1 hypothetical protein GCM10007920_08270 [Ciceribacter naphthalenivorans]GLT03898.1 hypothetical protein GCM10007926_08270 [Sphingomonas psychrolutea]
MTNEPDQFFERQDAAIQMLLVENKGDELTDILVAALAEAFNLLRGESPETTVH